MGVTDVNTFPCDVWVTYSSQTAVLNNRKKQPLPGSPPDLVQIARLATTFFVTI